MLLKCAAHRRAQATARTGAAVVVADGTANNRVYKSQDGQYDSPLLHTVSSRA